MSGRSSATNSNGAADTRDPTQPAIARICSNGTTSSQRSPSSTRTASGATTAVPAEIGNPTASIIAVEASVTRFNAARSSLSAAYAGNSARRIGAYRSVVATSASWRAVVKYASASMPAKRLTIRLATGSFALSRTLRMNTHRVNLISAPNAASENRGR